MKKITLSVFAVVSSCASLFSQVVLQENFTSPFSPLAAGWGTVNLSTTIGVIPGWFQGNGANFPAYNGAANDYYASHFNNGGGLTDISNWLFTPAVTIENGAVLQFATRCSNIDPDRLQVRFSTAGTSTVITPASSSAVGTYTNLMLDINPLYSLATTSVITGNTVNGYPDVWTVYTLQVTGVPVATLGRFAFRYFVEGSGPQGANGSYIGIDAVKYTLPCLLPTVQNFTTCPNTSSTLTAVGLPATTFSWSTGTNGPSTVVNPASTTVYSVYPIANGVPCGTFTTATITTGANLSVEIAATTTNVCAGSSAVLTAIAPATNFLWNNFQSTQSITITPTASGQYSVGASNGACVGGAIININVLPTPTLSYGITYASGTLGACPGTSFAVNASGAQGYLFVFSFGSAGGTPITVNTGSASPAGAETFTIYGQGANGCIVGGLASYSVHPRPTLAATGATLVCANRNLSLTATGANTYTWTNGTTATASNPYTVSVGATIGPRNYTITGRSAVGCTNTAVKSVSVVVCTGIENIFGEVSNIAVFPNPFTSELKVTGFSGKIEIVNAIGQVVYSSIVNESETINTADFAKGVYMVKSYNSEGEEIKTIKLVKN